MPPNSVLQKFCCTSSAGKGKAQTADKVTLTTGNMLDMLSSTGMEEADNKGLTHLKCRSKLSQGFSLWRYLTAAITFLFHVSTDFNSRSCNSSVIYSVHSDSLHKNWWKKKSLLIKHHGYRSKIQPCYTESNGNVIPVFRQTCAH